MQTRQSVAEVHTGQGLARGHTGVYLSPGPSCSTVGPSRRKPSLVSPSPTRQEGLGTDLGGNKTLRSGALVLLGNAVWWQEALLISQEKT